jgi:hypothetical protein
VKRARLSENFAGKVQSKILLVIGMERIWRVSSFLLFAADFLTNEHENLPEKQREKHYQ